MQTKLIKYVSIITFFIICGIWYVVTSQKQPEETILVKEEPAVQLADNIEISKNPKEDFKEKIRVTIEGKNYSALNNLLDKLLKQWYNTIRPKSYKNVKYIVFWCILLVHTP